MNTTCEMIALKLHKIENHIKPYVITLYCPSLSPNSSLQGEDIYNIVHSLVLSNNINLNDVTIFYYFSAFNRIEEINECVFDLYDKRFIGSRILKKDISEMSDSVYILHRAMLREIEDYNK